MRPWLPTVVVAGRTRFRSEDCERLGQDAVLGAELRSPPAPTLPEKKRALKQPGF